MKAKSIHYENPEHHGFLWYCFESIFHPQRFLAEVSGGGNIRHLKNKKTPAEGFRFFESAEEMDTYMKAVDEYHC